MKKVSSVMFVLVCICIAFLLFAGGCKRKQEKTEALPSPARHEVAAKTTLLATISDQEKPVGVQAPPAVNASALSSQSQPEFIVVFSKLGGGVAYIAAGAGKEFVVHNGKPGKHYDEIDKQTMALSQDGQRIAYGARAGTRWMMVVDGKEEGPYDECINAVFSPDNRHIAYQMRKSDKWHIVVDNNMNPGRTLSYDTPVFSSDSTKILTIEKTDEEGKFKLVVSDLAFEKQSVKVLRAPYIFENEDRTRIGAIEDSSGKQRVVVFDFNTLNVVSEGALYDSIRFPAFGPDGVTVAYAAARRERNGVLRFLILDNRVERLPDDAPMAFPVVRPDRKGAGMIMSTRTSYYLHQAFYDNGTKKIYYDEAADLVYNKDGSLHAMIARKAKKIFVTVNGKEGPAFDLVVAPVFSPDGKKIVYRARKSEDRFIVVADANGKILRKHPAYERVFEPVFTADRKSVAYGVKDGNKLIWKVEKL